MQGTKSCVSSMKLSKLIYNNSKLQTLIYRIFQDSRYGTGSGIPDPRRRSPCTFLILVFENLKAQEGRVASQVASSFVDVTWTSPQSKKQDEATQLANVGSTAFPNSI